MTPGSRVRGGSPRRAHGPCPPSAGRKDDPEERGVLMPRWREGAMTRGADPSGRGGWWGPTWRRGPPTVTRGPEGQRRLQPWDPRRLLLPQRRKRQGHSPAPRREWEAVLKGGEGRSGTALTGDGVHGGRGRGLPGSTRLPRACVRHRTTGRGPGGGCVSCTIDRLPWARWGVGAPRVSGTCARTSLQTLLTCYRVPAPLSRG